MEELILEQYYTLYQQNLYFVQQNEEEGRIIINTICITQKIVSVV